MDFSEKRLRLTMQPEIWRGLKFIAKVEVQLRLQK